MSSVQDIFDKKDGYYLSPNAAFRGGILFCIIIGVLAFTFALVTGKTANALGGLLFNAFFFFGISLIGVAFGGMQDVIGATWARPIKKLHESFASFLPVSGGILAILLICIAAKVQPVEAMYKWVANPDMLEHFEGKKVWLRPMFMVARDLGAIILICGLACWQLRLIKRRDALFMQGNMNDALIEGERVRVKLRYWGAPILVIYAFSFSLLGFDMLMSLNPEWLSTLYAAWLFAIAMQTFMATLLVVMFALRHTPLGQIYQRPQFHDVGKLLYGFTIFFAYLTYAHVLTYWYGNVPEETGYFIDRLQHPWLCIVMVAPLFSFVVPLFFLIPKAAKWTPGYTHFICFSVLIAQWFTFLLIVMPEVIKPQGVYIPFIEFGIFLGLLGLFLESIRHFGKKTPLLGVGDPLLYEHLDSLH